MEEIIFVKRSSHSQLRTFKKPVIKLELKNGRFIVSDIVAKALKVDDNDGLMFGFNQKAKTAYVVKDDEDDALRHRPAVDGDTRRRAPARARDAQVVLRAP